MEHKQELIKLILNNENRNAEAFLSEIREKSSCDRYAMAREKILLIETAKGLNNMIPAFYADIKKLTVNLFEENISVNDAVDYLCDKVRASVKEEKQTSYAKALDFIEENLCSNQLSVRLAAEYAGVSQSGLVKLFDENMGMTPGDYIGKSRSEKSLDYLRENVSVEKAALGVGYSSVEAYIRNFKKHMEITPGMWKRKNLFI